MASPMPRSTGLLYSNFSEASCGFLTGRKPCFDHAMQMPNQSVCSNDYPFVTTFPASQPWDAADPLPVMRREMKLLLIEIGQLRTEVEQLRAKEEEVQNVKEFLYRVIESRDQWQREAQRLRVDGESAALATILRALS
jgi:hypothetical protein